MIDPVLTRRWTYWAIFIGLAGVILFFRLLPLSTSPRVLPGPDLLICLAFAWIQRRPDFVPPVLLAGIMLLADALLMRPLGLWAALVLLGAEFLRSRQNPSTEMPLPAECGFVAVVVLAITGIYALLLGVLGAAPPQFTMLLVQAFLTVAVYPLVVLFSVGILKIRKPTQSELEAARTAR
ncbi:hypothetical protein ACMU_05385 [Actibacterium mucosum KCTC 23349]|uniref:Rod shape-determining protein MreD n=1 Tax=Actibacterium mucosum KCTC 23349 TaxID=1454373 RepID=A0A037ZJW0_9RHOB|nr:hypothetical protein [Actibacterium mucosum]KAJ56378.1 hypothetical protein ACMU_05385 [Actibacterium mucosum KCTC 23349]